MTEEDPRAVANREVPIARVFEAIGSPVNAYGKDYCPFGEISHRDGGTDKALRVYEETNSAFCFAGCGFFSPTMLAAQSWDVTEREAADRLLALIGWTPPTFEASWDALVSRPEEVDRDGLAEALRMFCSTQSPDWETSQFDPSVTQALGACLALLPRVRSRQDASLWLQGTKSAMLSVLTSERLPQ